MLRLFVPVCSAVLLFGSTLCDRAVRAAPGDAIQFGPPPPRTIQSGSPPQPQTIQFGPLPQTIRLYTPLRPDVSASQMETAPAILAHVFPLDGLAPSQSSAAGPSTGAHFLPPPPTPSSPGAGSVLPSPAPDRRH
jgi:hypothetical protein